MNVYMVLIVKTRLKIFANEATSKKIILKKRYLKHTNLQLNQPKIANMA